MRWSEITAVSDGLHATLGTPASRTVDGTSTVDVGTDNTCTIQSALDAAAGNGGDDVYVPAGIYMAQNTLLVGSNVHLYGAGPGATVIRDIGSAFPCRQVNGAVVCAGIAIVAATHSSISQLTLDQ